MNTSNRFAHARILRLCTAGLVLAALCACSALRSTSLPPPTFYSIEGVQSTTATPDLVSTQTPEKIVGPTLIVNPPRAASGFDSPRIIYTREPYKIEHFAHNEWVDPPARMLGPLLVAAIAKTGAFGAVVLTPGAATGDLRLDTEIVRLQHEFQTLPSRVHFTLRATLVDERSRRVLAWQDFDSTAVAESDDPIGGVMAANRVVQAQIDKLADFCAASLSHLTVVKLP